MFHVENADFIADKLAAELLPNQEFREVLKNALEAVERRMGADGSTDGGRIVFDVDWPSSRKRSLVHLLHRQRRRNEPLGVGALHHDTRRPGRRPEPVHPRRPGDGTEDQRTHAPQEGRADPLAEERGATSVQVGGDGAEYGLIPIGPNNEVVVPAAASLFPAFVNSRATGRW